MHLDNEQQSDLSSLLVVLLKAVLYEDKDQKRWSHLLTLQNRVRDYVSVLGLELVLDESEGYAFLRTQKNDSGADEDERSEEIPRLIIRRQLSFPVSLLLALLRKKLAEFDASGNEIRLILTRDNIIDLIQLFVPDSSNEAKIVDKIEQHINKVIELGFLRRLKSTNPDNQSSYEVRRIIKAFIDAQWLSAFDEKLKSYQQELLNRRGDSE